MRNRVKYFRIMIVLTVLLMVAGLFPHPAALAGPSAPSLASAQSFTVLAGSAVTNTGDTTVSGDLGVSPGSAITGFPPGIVSGGTTHEADAAAAQGAGGCHHGVQ